MKQIPKGIKKTAKILVSIVAWIALFFAAIPILLHFSNIQNFVAKVVINELSNKLDSKVSIASIQYKLFNTVRLNDFYLEDLENDTLLYIEDTYVDFNFWGLLKGKVQITDLEFDNLHANLKTDTLGHSNLDFVIEALKSPKKNNASKVEYEIDRLSIKNSYLSYSKQNGKPTKAFDSLNPDSLRFSNINAEIVLNVLNKDTLSASINSLSLHERSGFIIDNFSTEIEGSRSSSKIKYLELLMPHSNINLTDIELEYDSLTNLKNFTKKVKLKIPIKKSNIGLADLSAFLPEFSQLKNPVSIGGVISGRLSSLRFQNMEFKYGKSLYLNADLDLSGLPNIDETFVYAQIHKLKADKNDMQDVVSIFVKRPLILPKELNQLGTVNYTGNITGFFSNMVVYGNLTTNMGSVSSDILLKLENNLKDISYNGTVKSRDFMLGKLLNNKKLGKVSFNINTNGTKNYKSSLNGDVKATIQEIEFNNYTYQDISFKGKYDGTGFDGEIALEDENINANFKGVIDLTKKLPVFDFELQVDNCNLNALHIIKQYPDALLSFDGKTNMVGNSLDNINGFIRFDNIVLDNEQKTLNVNEITFLSKTEDHNTEFTINSDYVKGSFTGNFKYSTIGQTINKTIHHYLPALALKISSDEKHQNQIDIDIQIQNTEDISDLLNIPYVLDSITTIKGKLDEVANIVSLTGNIPTLKTKKQNIENITLKIESVDNLLKFTSRAEIKQKTDLISFYLFAAAADDSISTQIGWQNSRRITNAGEIQTTTKFRNEDGKTAARMSILPTQIIISDSIWDIRYSNISLNTDSTIDIHGFRFDNNKQFVHIDGKLSKSQNDSVTISMNDLNLDYIMKVVKLKGISIGGIVTGKATLLSALQKPIFIANIGVDNLSINEKRIADAKVVSTWDNENKRVLLDSKFYNEQKDIIALAKGAYVPKYDSIDIVFDTRGISIEFLNKYFTGVVDNVKGYGYGNLHMFGPMKTIGFEGNIFVDKGQGTPKMLKTTYFFNDTVRLTRKTIELRNIKLTDEEKNQGLLNGHIKHNGLFLDMDYNVNIKAKNILAMNTQAEDNDYFFGKAYVTGNVSIYGNDKEANIIVNAVSQKKTKCYIQMGGASSASDNSFVNFVAPKNLTRVERRREGQKTDASKFNVKVDMHIDVTPDAEMELIVDPKGGDVITGRGNANLRIQFDSFSDIKLYGTYNIDVGYYLFTLQTVIRKEFKIDKGSNIVWTGDPFNAQVNIRALYPLTASLSDLIEDVGETTNRGSVPVNVVLNLTEGLMKPTIKFEIDLPQSDEGVKQQVKSIISTNEMMNQQVVYLLVMNKFYMPDKATVDGENAGWDNTISFVTSTASSHLNNLVQKMFNTNSFSVGVDVKKNEVQSTDYKAQLNYQNNRVIVNSNIGYRDGVSTSPNPSKFIGDFDVEYLLTESGRIRAKAYSHTVDRSQLKEAKSTQGVGLIYKADFESVSDMLSYYWNLLIGKKKSNDEE